MSMQYIMSSNCEQNPPLYIILYIKTLGEGGWENLRSLQHLGLRMHRYQSIDDVNAARQQVHHSAN